MKTTVFNLRSFKRQAYYEDAKGLIQPQSRGWMNCYKLKVSAGISPHEAIETCMEEYQTLSNGDWAFKYASPVSDK
jgi:hypothetical protein